MSSFIRWGLVMAGAVALAACEDKKPEAAPSASSAPVPDDQIATSADFEEKAAQEITADNAEQELGKLEKEISE
jgi:hypothetical protein